jgi:hypothetical protein
MDELTPTSFKPLLDKLVQTPEYFAPDDLKLALNHLFTPDAVLPAQIGAFLAALHIHRVERRPDSLAAAAAVLRERALKAVVEDYDSDFVVDIVGTGGDGFNLFNVSTTAAIVAAGAGARVIKVRIVSGALSTPKLTCPFFLRPAWFACIHIKFWICGSVRISGLCVRRACPRNHYFNTESALYIYSRPTLPSLLGVHCAVS